MKPSFLSNKELTFAKEVAPVFCVDVVLIPEEEVSSVILFRRDMSAANPNIFWIIGGRQQKGETVEETAMRKIKSETGFDIVVNPDNQLFATDIIHKKGKGGSYLAEFLLRKWHEVHGLIRRLSSINTWRIG